MDHCHDYTSTLSQLFVRHTLLENVSCPSVIIIFDNHEAIAHQSLLVVSCFLFLAETHHQSGEEGQVAVPTVVSVGP